MIFNKKAPEIAKPKKAWPSELNPCPVNHNGNAALWGVHGHATKVCNKCVFDLENKMKQAGEKDPRTAALATFTPDPNGAKCVES